ncbi:MAG: Rieske (2Fe-2S) protein [Cyanobacteria bacterium J06600_6]
MQRRKFIHYVRLGAIASYLSVALAACTDSETLTENEEDISVTESELLTIGTIAQLEESGFLLNEESTIMVIKDKNGKLVAVNPTCTHQGCTVEWQNDENVLLCPCHAAKFTADGKVLAEPAPSPLPTYEAIAEQGQVIVKI